MKNLYIILIALLLTNGCKKDKPDYADKPDTHTYHYLTQEQLNKTPYFTNPAFDTLTFLSNANDTLIFAKLKTDTFYHKTSRSDCPDCPVHYSYYQELHKTYQTIKGNGKFEVRHSKLDFSGLEGLVTLTFNNLNLKIRDYFINSTYKGIYYFDILTFNDNTYFSSILVYHNLTDSISGYGFVNKDFGFFHIDNKLLNTKYNFLRK